MDANVEQGANAQQAEFWTDIAPTWLQLEAHLERVSGDPGRAAMGRLGLRPGQRVIDLGCGSGRTTVELARRVAPGGHVLGVDIAEPMVDHARGRAEEAGAGASLEFRRADVQSQELGPHSFDAAYSRFGVMFFADPVAAFANVRRATTGGGVLGFACWRSLFDNEWMLVPGMAAAGVLGVLPPMPEPGAPGPFSLEDLGRIREVLAAAGWSDIDVATFDEPLDLPEAELATFATGATQVGAVREALREADDETRRRVVEAVGEALAQRVADGAVRLARGVHLVRAVAP